MKSPILQLLTAALFFASTLQGATFQLRVAKADPQSPWIEQVHQGRKLHYGVQISHELDLQRELWLDAGVMTKEGRSIPNLHAHTHLRLHPVHLGANLLFPLHPYATLYLGAGLGCSWLKVTHNDPKFKLFTSNQRRAPSGVLKSGLRLSQCDNFFVDLFLDYTFHRFHFKDTATSQGHWVNLSGPRYGIGLGCYF